MMQPKVVSIGRMAVFLIPTHKLRLRVDAEHTAEERIRNFLFEKYTAFTENVRNSTGLWTAESGKKHLDEHREFKAAFAGKDRIPELECFLAVIARDIGEECIYLETGEEASLVYAAEPEADSSVRSA